MSRNRKAYLMGELPKVDETEIVLNLSMGICGRITVKRRWG